MADSESPKTVFEFVFSRKEYSLINLVHDYNCSNMASTENQSDSTKFYAMSMNFISRGTKTALVNLAVLIGGISVLPFDICMMSSC
jgi:hypothetical protein